MNTTVKTDPVLEAIARKLFGFSQCPKNEQAKMMTRAAKAGAEAARQEVHLELELNLCSK